MALTAGWWGRTSRETSEEGDPPPPSLPHMVLSPGGRGGGPGFLLTWDGAGVELEDGVLLGCGEGPREGIKGKLV